MQLKDDRIQFFNTTDYPPYREDILYFMIVDGKFKFIDPVDQAKHSKEEYYPLFWRWKLFVDKHVTKTHTYKYMVYCAYKKDQKLDHEMYWTYYDNGCLVEDMMEFTSKNNFRR